MKRILIILLLAVAAFPAFAQMGTPIIIPLWPDGAPNDNGIVTEEGHPSPRASITFPNRNCGFSRRFGLTEL